MPAAARIVSMESSGLLYVTDSAINLKKIARLIIENAVKPSVEMKKRWKEEELLRRKQSISQNNNNPAPH